MSANRTALTGYLRRIASLLVGKRRAAKLEHWFFVADDQGIYRDWMARNRPLYLQKILGWLIIIYSINIVSLNLIVLRKGFDSFADFFDKRTLVKSLMVPVGSLCYFLLRRLNRRGDYRGGLFVSIIMSLVMFSSYFTMLEISGDMANSLTAKSTLFVICIMFLVYKDYRTDMNWCVVSCCLLAVIFGYASPVHRGDYYLFALIALCNYTALRISNSFFIKSMLSNYWNLSKNIGSEIAHKLVIENRRMEEEPSLKARSQDVYCLISDWRSFQKIARSSSPETVNMLFEAFYALVFSKIDYIKSRYRREFDVGELVLIVNWVADELFVAVYADEKDKDKAREVIFSIVEALGRDIFEEFNRDLSETIHYDIGVSFGKDNIVGLCGPPISLRFTVTGDGAGIAKRMQTLAKEYRKTQGLVLGKPLIAMEENLAALFDARTAFELIGKEKSSTQDIEGRTVAIFSSEGLHPMHRNQSA